MDFFTGIWPIYKTLANVDIAQAGMIAGISGFMGEILQIFFGYFCDRGYRKRILLLGLTFASAIIWITFSNGIFNSFIILFLLMLGSGCFHPAALGIVSNLSQEKKGGTILLFASGGAIGLGISQLTFTKLMDLFDGHALILLIPLGVLFTFIFFHEFPRQTYIPPKVSFKELFQPIVNCRRPLIQLYLSQVAVQGLVLAFIFLLPDLLRARECNSWVCMGGGHLCFILGSAVMMIPAGYLCDKYGQKSVLLVVTLCAIALFYLFLSQRTLPFGWMILLLSSLGSFLGIINPIIVSWGNRLVPQSPSTVSALLMGFAWCLSNLGPAWAGFLAKSFNQEPHVNAMALMGTALVGIFLLFLFMPRQKEESLVHASSTTSSEE